MTVKSTSCGFDLHSRKRNIYIGTFIFSFLRSGVEAKLSSATQHALPPELGGYMCQRLLAVFNTQCLEKVVGK